MREDPMKKMKSDYLVVQKQLDKTEKSQLKTAEAIYKAKNKPIKNGVKLYQNGGTGYVTKDDITKNSELVDVYKVLIPAAGSGSRTG